MVEMNRNKHDSKLAGLVCPETKLPLEVVDQATLSVINEKIKNRQLKCWGEMSFQDTFETGLIQRYIGVFYPIKEGIPLLLASDGIHYNIEHYGAHTRCKAFEQINEQIFRESKANDFFSEVYLKNLSHGDLKHFAGLRPGKLLSELDKINFPDPMNLWVDTGLDQYYAYTFLTPCNKKRYLQVGGHGNHAIKFLLAGAKEAVTVDPSFKSLIYGRKVADLFGIEREYTPIRGCGEFIPYPDNYFDYIYAGGVLHHTDLRKTAKELYRVLKKGGKGAFVEPLHGNFLYRALSKAHKDLRKKRFSDKEGYTIDHPLRYGDVNDFISHFDRGSFREFELFGIAVDILLLLFQFKLDRSKIIYKINTVDDFLLRHVNFARKFAGIVTMLVEKE